MSEYASAVELHFYEMRGGSLGKSVVIHANLEDPVSVVVAKAAKMLELDAEEVALVTPQGIPVTVYEEGREKTVKEIVEKYGFSFAIVTRDLLGN
ncbi:MAG: hypothetical protein ACTSVA_05895 [Candidatus Njordarchaeales archaeon]